MEFLNDWIALALGVSVICGGAVAGRRLGMIASWWLAGGAWLAFRLTDAVWKPAVIELRANYADTNLASAIPMVYALVFCAVLLLTAILMAVARPKNDFVLPGKIDLPLGVLGGVMAGAVLMLALVQAHVMHPVIRERMPVTVAIAGSTLDALGQKNIGPAAAVPPPPPHSETK